MKDKKEVAPEGQAQEQLAIKTIKISNTNEFNNIINDLRNDFLRLKNFKLKIEIK